MANENCQNSLCKSAEKPFQVAFGRSFFILVINLNLDSKYALDIREKNATFQTLLVLEQTLVCLFQNHQITSAAQERSEDHERVCCLTPASSIQQ